MDGSSGKGIFKSFLMGGFECSTHRIRTGRRLDMIAATRHDEFAEADYERLLNIGLKTCRDGLRWHLIETEPYRYDFSSLVSQVRAARRTGIEVIWDFFHYGYPDDLDLFSPEFPQRFAAFSRAAAEFIGSETGLGIYFCPINEISYFAWAAGDVAMFYPHFEPSHHAIKKQLVRAGLASIDAVLEVDPFARWLLTEPAVHVVPNGDSDEARLEADASRTSQFEGLDMITGRLAPELGGSPRYLDLVGLNYYIQNQWTHPHRHPIGDAHELYRPPHQIFLEFAQRYGRPVMISETGIEDDRRAGWFEHVMQEVAMTRKLGKNIIGTCLYPIVNHPGWEDERHCHNGIWDYPDENGVREAHEPLLTAVRSRIDDQAVVASAGGRIGRT